MRCSVCAALALLLYASIAVAQASASPQFVSGVEATAEIEGSVFSTGYGAAAVNIRIPQADVFGISSSAENMLVFDDSSENKVLRLVVNGIVPGDNRYSVRISFRNSAKVLASVLPVKSAAEAADSGKEAGYWLQESQYVRLTEEIIREAWPFDRSLGHAAYLAEQVRARGGSASELAALLRASGIPARIAEGYVQEAPEAYTRSSWVEALASNDGKDVWVPFDQQSGNSGWIDATHIPFAYLLDTSHYSQGIEYSGTGRASLSGESVRITAASAERASQPDASQILAYSKPATSTERAFVLSAVSPARAEPDEEIRIRVYVQNLKVQNEDVFVRVRIGSQEQERWLPVLANEMLGEDFIFRAQPTGTLTYIATTSDPAVEVVYGKIEIAPRPQDLLTAVTGFFSALGF